MFDFMVRVSQLVLPIFIFCTMANIGMTQHPGQIVKYWRDWPFYLKMVVANFVAAPAAMWLLLQIWPLRVDDLRAIPTLSIMRSSFVTAPERLESSIIFSPEYVLDPKPRRAPDSSADEAGQVRLLSHQRQRADLCINSTRQ